MTAEKTITDEAISRALERVLVPVLDVVCEMECLRRKEYLTTKEAALLFSLSAATLKTKRSRGGGPDYVKRGSRVLYARKALEAYLEGQGGGIKFQNSGG